MPRKKKATFHHPRLLPLERVDQPPLFEHGDECYTLGAACFHVTALLNWLQNHPQPIVDIPVDLWDPPSGQENQHVEMADLTRPILVVEMAPDLLDYLPNVNPSDWIRRGYVCIDGYHRLEKARRLGMSTLPAVVLRMEQHIPFVFEYYERYAPYWNEKLEDRAHYAESWKTSRHAQSDLLEESARQ